MSIVCHVLVHDSPKPFDRVQVRAVRGQLDKMDTTLWPCEKFSDIWRFVIGGIVPDDMDQSLVRVACFNLGEKLCGADPIDGRGLDKGCVEGFQVDRAMDINPAAGCRGRDCRI
jgi:hypothetical protein